MDDRTCARLIIGHSVQLLTIVHSAYILLFLILFNIHIFFIHFRYFYLILSLFMSTATFTGSWYFFVDAKYQNTVILTGLTYTSSLKLFHDIMTNIGVK